MAILKPDGVPEANKHHLGLPNFKYVTILTNYILLKKVITKLVPTGY